MKKVFVSGCYDMLHSGHVAFLSEAAQHGHLYVGIGADENIHNLKGRYPINTQEERLYMLRALKCVHEVTVNSGWGILDFETELNTIQPDMFIVNEDGNTPAKAELVTDKGIEYLVLKREPHKDLPRRSTTSLRTLSTIPYRIDLAGGWLDQPYVSKHHPGSMMTISIEPTVEFNERSGMASSTRRKAIELWQAELPSGDRQKLAKVLFSYENPPGTEVVSGSQDALGIVMPGLNRLDYDGGYWPAQIISEHKEKYLQFIEDHLYLVTLGPRETDYDVLQNTKITQTRVRKLSKAADFCWNAIMNQDLPGFGKAVRASFEAQVAMFPHMIDPYITQTIDHYRDQAYGWKLSGAGGGGYLILVAENDIEGAMKIKIRRRSLVT